MFKFGQEVINNIEGDVSITLENLLNLDPSLGGICMIKRIEVDNKNRFVLNNRESILDYHTLVKDYKGIVRNLLIGKAVLNESQLEEYQRKNSERDTEKFSRGLYFDTWYSC